jgi:hypothetical protein
MVSEPLIRKYPHINDSRMSTYLTSTSTSYCWRSEVWLPLKRLPGRKRDDDEFGRNCVSVNMTASRHVFATRLYGRTLYAGNGDARWLANADTGAGAFVDGGEACDVRCSSDPSSVVVMGVGISRFGASIVFDVLVWSSEGDCACVDGSCGGGVGCCIGASTTDSTLLLALLPCASFNSCALVMRVSSGGQVARPAMLSCSTGETVASSGVGMFRASGTRQSRREE